MNENEIKEILEKDFYTTKELAELVGLSQATIRRYVRSGKMRAIYQGMGSKMKIPAEDVYNFFKDSLFQKGE